MIIKEREVTNSPTREPIQSDRSLENQVEKQEVKTEASPLLKTVHSPQSSMTPGKESELELVGKQLGTNIHTEQDAHPNKKYSSKRSYSNSRSRSRSRSRSKSLSNILKVPKIDKIQKFNHSKLENEYGYPILPNKLTINWEERNKIME